ncbi:MAG: transcriptional regulator, partial [Verrucomicrobia bacterium]|nr:transcriptional regulator [Verrucomicrobiota bacterium]
MKLSRKGEYALRALICLGLGEAYGLERLQVAEIAASDHIPEKFLEQIMNDLRDGGFVKGLRGRKGGYRL